MAIKRWVNSVTRLLIDCGVPCIPCPRTSTGLKTSNPINAALISCTWTFNSLIFILIVGCHHWLRIRLVDTINGGWHTNPLGAQYLSGCWPEKTKRYWGWVTPKGVCIVSKLMIECDNKIVQYFARSSDCSLYPLSINGRMDEACTSLITDHQQPQNRHWVFYYQEHFFYIVLIANQRAISSSRCGCLSSPARFHYPGDEGR